VISFLAEEVATQTSCHSTHETSFAFLRIVWVARVIGVAVWIACVAGWRRALAPRMLLAALLVVLGLHLVVLRLLAAASY